MLNQLLAAIIAMTFCMPSFGASKICRHLLSPRPKTKITKQKAGQITSRLKRPLQPGEIGVRQATDELEETPDPSRPMPLPLPNGDWIIQVGLSGQKAIHVKSTKVLFRGGILPVEKMRVFNQYGFEYGKELDQNGNPVHYAFNSSLWDTYATPIRKMDGSWGMKLFGGGMANYENGHPRLTKDGYRTRQRIFFDAEWVQGMNGKLEMHAKNPETPLNTAEPDQDHWTFELPDGRSFKHGYGGGPETLLNGEFYTTPEGWVPVHAEAVVEEGTGPNGEPLPALTVQIVYFMDKELKRMMAEPKIAWSPIKKDGTPYKAALRPSYHGSPLAEGLQLTPKFRGRPIRSAAHLAELRQIGAEIYHDGILSHGEYYGTYGATGIRFDEDFSNAQPMLDEDGELENFLEPLRVLYAWLGRGTLAYDFEIGNLEIKTIDDQEYVIAHGADRSKVPNGVPMNQPPHSPEIGENLNRQVLVIPIKRVKRKGREHIVIYDNTGLLEELSQYYAPDVWD